MTAQRRPFDDHEGQDAEAHATRVIERWRRNGFDTVLVHPSGYCSPANSSALTAALREGYTVFQIASNESAAAIARSIVSGMPYRV